MTASIVVDTNKYPGGVYVGGGTGGANGKNGSRPGARVSAWGRIGAVVLLAAVAFPAWPSETSEEVPAFRCLCPQDSPRRFLDCMLRWEVKWMDHCDVAEKGYPPLRQPRKPGDPTIIADYHIVSAEPGTYAGEQTMTYAIDFEYVGRADFPGGYKKKRKTMRETIKLYRTSEGWRMGRGMHEQYWLEDMIANDRRNLARLQNHNPPIAPGRWELKQLEILESMRLKGAAN